MAFMGLVKHNWGVALRGDIINVRCFRMFFLGDA
jgi:hypothetical protein